MPLEILLGDSSLLRKITAFTENAASQNQVKHRSLLLMLLLLLLLLLFLPTQSPHRGLLFFFLFSSFFCVNNQTQKLLEVLIRFILIKFSVICPLRKRPWNFKPIPCLVIRIPFVLEQTKLSQMYSYMVTYIYVLGFVNACLLICLIGMARYNFTNYPSGLCNEHAGFEFSDVGPAVY